MFGSKKCIFVTLFKRLFLIGVFSSIILYIISYNLYISNEIENKKIILKEKIDMLKDLNVKNEFIYKQLEKNNINIITAPATNVAFTLDYKGIQVSFSNYVLEKTIRDLNQLAGSIIFFWVMFLLYMSNRLSNLFKPLDDIRKYLEAMNLKEPKYFNFKKNSFVVEDIEVLKEKINSIVSIIIDEQDKNEKLIHFDNLLNIPNSVKLQKDFEEIIKKEKEFVLMFLDLNDFKAINDSLGHEHGDNVLKEISSLLYVENKCNIYRLGGDEFIILENIQNLKKSAKKILKLIKDYKYQDTYDVGVSIGISFYKEGKTLDILKKEADLAMYEAKGSKEDYSFYRESMSIKIKERFDLTNELKLAIENDEFVCYYQPQINYLERKIFGAEALIRWNHPTKGLLFPYLFIEVLENSELILKAGLQIIEQVFKKAVYLNKNKTMIEKISINLCKRQIDDNLLFTKILKCLAETGCKPEWIEFEITERSFINFKKTSNLINKLHESGFSVSLDDFGTGYSSLDLVQNIKIDKLKVDKVFVDNKENGIMDIIISLGKTLNTELIVEGIETFEQLEYVNERGCFNIQGYYFSKPLNEHDFENILYEYNAQMLMKKKA